MRLADPKLIRARERKLEEVEVPDWGGSVLLRRLSIAQATAQDGGFMDAVSLIIASVVNEDGTPFFDADAAEWLKDEDLAAIKPLLDKIRTINGMGSLADAVKN